jgi:tetrahydromethanopterin S-methyltransferase subunit A
MALHENGVDPDKRSIVGAHGAIPYIENVPDEGLDRFRSQFEMIDLIDVEDAASIGAKVKECIEKDPGAIEEEALVIVIEEEGGDVEEGEEVRPVSPETALIEARMRVIQTQVKSVGSIQRQFAGMYVGKVQGIVVGLAFILTLGTILFLNGGF